MNTKTIAAASVTGARHRADGVGNQDAFAVREGRDRFVAVVCDGCGSAPASGVGAYLGARIVAEAVMREGPRDWAALTAAITARLEAVAEPSRDALAEAFLFTIVGVTIDASAAVFFALGDGVIGCNGRTIALGPFEDNAPPYLAYRLIDGRDVALAPVLTCPAGELERFWIGTDGAADLPEGTLDGDACFAHPDALRRHLTQLSQPGVRVTAAGRERVPSVLKDDTTVVIGKRGEPWKR
jgi:hypothetical protein